jgi:hypothetical protein
MVLCVRAFICLHFYDKQLSHRGHVESLVIYVYLFVIGVDKCLYFVVVMIAGHYPPGKLEDMIPSDIFLPRLGHYSPGIPVDMILSDTFPPRLGHYSTWFIMVQFWIIRL